MKSSETNHNRIHVTISLPDGRPIGIWINSFDELDEEIERIHKRWYELEQKKNYNHIVLKEKCPRCS